MLQAIQLGMNSSDIPGSLRLYSEAFGFRNAGAQGLWGPMIGVQGLDPSSRAIIWWMVGAQNFFQLEFFSHSHPAQRPIRPDWRASDHGWVRFGCATADFERAVAVLTQHRVKLSATLRDSNGLRRSAFRDPYVGTFVEIMEDGPDIAGHSGPLAKDGPCVVYATSSVSDLSSAEVFYRDVLGFEIAPIDLLHAPEHEKLWDLASARRDGFLVKAGMVYLEILHYEQPAGRPRPADYRSSDQGLVNVALGSRCVSEIAQAFERMQNAGYVPPYKVDTGTILAGYITDPERELEFMGLPHEIDRFVGFEATQPFATGQ